MKARKLVKMNQQIGDIPQLADRLPSMVKLGPCPAQPSPDVLTYTHFPSAQEIEVEGSETEGWPQKPLRWGQPRLHETLSKTNESGIG